MFGDSLFEPGDYTASDHRSQERTDASRGGNRGGRRTGTQPHWL